MDLEDEKQPFEFMAEEQSLLRKRPAAPAGRASGGAKAKAAKSRKGTLDGFVTRGAPADEEDDFDDDDDDDDDGLGFNFGAHKTPPVAAAKLSSVFDAPKESKHEVRQLVTGSNGRWRGKLVPAGAHRNPLTCARAVPALFLCPAETTDSLDACLWSRCQQAGLRESTRPRPSPMGIGSSHTLCTAR